MEIILRSLVEQLNKHTKLYDEGRPEISDKEWDDMYFHLENLEKATGIVLENSPTRRVIYQVVNELEKVEHSHKMLSLDKTKELEVVKGFIGNNEFIAMCKMDGLTCTLRYENGKLVGAETRGDGLIGENILHNAKVIPSIPKKIPYTETLVVDGEIICTKRDFQKFSSDYKNPRNFASGSVRLLDPRECAKRDLTFVAWDVIEGLQDVPKLIGRLNTIRTFDFKVVPYVIANNDMINDDLIDIVKTQAELNSYPIDGAVFKFNDIEFGKAQGETSHHFKNAIAYKFYDEVYKSKLQTIEWTMGRTGILTPVAVFDTIDMDGSSVSRASLHNISVMTETMGGAYVGQEVEVFKANMIIPQIYSAADAPSASIELIRIPTVCPVCGGEVKVIDNDGVKVLMCLNDNCEGKLINRLDHFCGKKGLDIKGLSKATLEKLVDWGWVNSIFDIMVLINHRSEWIKQPGFGAKSVDKILDAIEEAKFCTLDAFISSLGIPLIGKTVSKELVKHISTYEEFRLKVNDKFDFSKYDGFAGSKTLAIWNFDFTEADKVYPYLFIVDSDKPVSTQNCVDLKVVITGKLKQFKNRDALKKAIEERGGKVVDSVSKNTTCLINNDVNSTSTKNQSAKKLEIPILTEEQFINRFLTL